MLALSLSQIWSNPTIPDLLLEPVKILGKELHAVDEAAIRTESELVHDLYQFHEVGDVNVGLVRQQGNVVGRVQVDNSHRAAESAEELQGPFSANLSNF
jgi:hypothetical protein